MDKKTKTILIVVALAIGGYMYLQHRQKKLQEEGDALASVKEQG